jgi:hypothetical protein
VGSIIAAHQARAAWLTVISQSNFEGFDGSQLISITPVDREKKPASPLQLWARQASC